MACVNEAIVKIHSSINLGYVRNSPSTPRCWMAREKDSTKGCARPWAVARLSLLGGRQMPCANHRLELEDD